MAAQTYQSAARLVDRGREQHRHRSVSSQPMQELQLSCDSNSYDQPQPRYGQHAYVTNQQYEKVEHDTIRAWTRQNPEVHCVIHDTRLNQSLDTSGSAANEAYGQAPYVHADPYGSQSQQTQANRSGDQQHSRSSLTARQLYDLNYGREPSSSMEIWWKEEQRKGPWYGSVEPLKTPYVDEAQAGRGR